MADNFLEEYQANKDQEAMAGLDKLIAKERLTSKLAAGEDMAGIAMMAAGPQKFTKLLGMVPKTFDKVDNLPAFRKLFGEIKKLPTNQQKEAAGVILPRLNDTVYKIDRTYANDILNNPKANKEIGLLLNKNNDYTKGLIQELQKLVGMNTGGAATLMPLKYN